MKKITIIFLSFALVFFCLPALSFAQPTQPPVIVIDNPAGPGNDNLIDLLQTLLRNVVMPVAAVLVVLYIIYAGFTFVSAQGNSKKVDEAKQRLLWALIGAGVLLGAVGISDVVVNTVRAIFPV